MTDSLVQKEARQQRIFRQEVEMLPHDLRNFVRKCNLFVHQYRINLCGEEMHLFLQYPLEKLLLAAEVVMQQGVGDAGPLRDGDGACAGVTLLKEFRLGSLQNRLFAVFLVFHLIQLILAFALFTLQR